MGHILIVDDDESVRELIKDILTMHGHTMDLAANGSEAVAFVVKKPYDLVIMDRNMPKTDGVQAVAIIRSNPKYKSLKILMCTSVSVTREVDEAFEAGANDYILKPINMTQLVTKVAKALGQA